MNTCVCCGREIPEGLQVCPQCEFTCEEPHIKDSGNRREFSTGAVRDIQEGKGRCDLLPLGVISECLTDKDRHTDDVIWHIYMFQKKPDEIHTKYLISALNYFCQKAFSNSRPTMILEVSKHFEEGAKKYGEYNWQKGIPIHCYIDSAVRHYLKWLRGDKDEAHDRAFVWNILCCIWTVENKEELKVEVQ